MEVRFHRLAAREFREAQKWYESRRTGLSGDFVTGIVPWSGSRRILIVWPMITGFASVLNNPY